MLLVVAAALINQDDEILMQKRPEGCSMAGLWEFPGGKVESGESPENALIRELKEELGVEVLHSDLSVLTFASEPLDGKHLLLLLYTTHFWEGTPRAIESPELRWVSVRDLAGLDMPPADYPFIEALEKYLRS